MVGPIYRKGNNHFQLLATGVLEGPPDKWWEEVVVLQMLEAPWGVVVMRKERLDDMEEVTDRELVVMGREAAELARFTP